MFHGEHGWAPLKATPRLRVGIYKAILTAVADADCKVIHSGSVRKETAKEWPDHHPTEHAHRVAFFGLLQEVAIHSERESDRALLIADEVSRTSGELLRQDVRWLQERNERVIDTVHFIQSHESPLVQAADMVGYIHRRVRARTESDPRAEATNQTLARIVEPLVVARRRWPDQPLR